MKNINKVILQEFQAKHPSTKVLFKSNATAWPKVFFIAGLVSGINWYYQSFWANSEINRQRSIMDRVEKDEIRHDCTRQYYVDKKNFDFHEADEWEGQKVKLDGILLPNRFVVKRKRGDQ